MTQHLDLDALQAELEWCIAEGHSGPRTHACLKSLQTLIDRLRKAEAQHADLLKSMFEIAWSNDSQWQTDAAKQACLRNPALNYRAAPDSTPTDSADSEGAKG